MKSHINLHVAALIAAMMALGAQAAPVSSAQVRAAVTAWSSANGAAFAGLGEASEPSAVSDDDGTVLYWIVPMSNGGAVIASPDTDLDLVVSVLEKYDGPLPEGHPLPAILKKDMSNRLAVLAKREAANNPVPQLRASAGQGGSATEAFETSEELESSIAGANSQWAKYGVATAGAPLPLKAAALEGGDGSPFVRRVVDGFGKDGRFTHWNQSGGTYNYHTPNNEVCGCVATAGAAILQFFNCTNDPGTVKSTVGCKLYGHAYDCTTMAGAPDWASLPESCGGADGNRNLTDADRSLLGQVTYNMGVLVGMSWASDGPGSESGAYVSDLTKAFKAYGFKTARYIQYSNSASSDGGEFFKTLYAQLWCGAPAVLGIQRPGAGHAVVACGYARDADGDEFCRIFMGWGGSGDNWYKLPKISDYIQVQGATTMLGYEDDAVVPVYGETNMPGVEFGIPGYETNGVPVKVEVDGHGYFGIRVPYGLADKTLVYEPRGKSVTITPFDAAVLANEDADRAKLDPAIPNEIYFPLLNMTMKQTLESGKAVAERDGKALLILSGTASSDRFKLLTDYLYYLDDVTDLSNKFVYVVTSTSSSNPNEPDGDPSIGVFDPADFVPNERWKASNAKLQYETFIDYLATGETNTLGLATNVVIYTYGNDDTAAVTNCLDAILPTGYDMYLRRSSDIQMTVRGVNVADENLNEVATAVPGYGTITDAWTNGEFAVFSAPGTYTNESKGVIYSCVGWTTNDFSSVEELVEAGFTQGAEAEIQLFAGMTNTLTWIWDASHYRVTAALDRPYTSAEDWKKAISPTNAWVAADTRVTITAEPVVKSFHFSEWTVQGTVDYRQSSNAGLYDNGTAVSFFVNEPVTVTANYRNGTSGAPVSTTNTLVFASSPADLAGKAPLPVAESGFDWGENKTLDNGFTFMGGTYTDSTGGVWKCVYAKVAGVIYEPPIGFANLNLRVSNTVTFTWELQTNPSPIDPDPPTPVDPDPPTPVDPDPPTPADITITGIEQASDGSWTITVSGAVKDCWYWLYSTDDLANVAGTSDAWTATKAATVEDNPQQAAEDGDIVFHAEAAGSALFWRAKATSTESGD